MRFIFFIIFICINIQPLFGQTITCSKAKHFERKLKSSSLKSDDLLRMEKYDLTYLLMDLNVSNTTININGSVSLKGFFKKEIDSILLELHPDFIIDSILVNQKKVSYIRTNTLLKIPNTASDFNVSVFYQGAKTTPQGQFMGGSGVIKSGLFTYTLSEPFAADEWWPSKQSLNDKIDSADLYFTASNPNLVGSNGKLIEKIFIDSSTTKFHWKTIYPTDYYLFSFACGPYYDYSFNTYIKEANDSLLVQNFIYNDSTYIIDNKSNIKLTGNYLQLFSSLYGVYPFIKEKYGHCVTDIGGGMEHQTMSTLDNFNPSLVSHELAHQWFGDNVTCASFQDIWLNEGFASYSEYLMNENLFPDQKAYTLSMFQEIAKTQKTGSVWVQDTTNEERIFSSELTYKKGASIIHTLRYIINDDNLFFKGLSEYQKQFAYSSAKLSDFKTSMEKICKMDFTNFFNEWYYGEGYPIYSFKSEITDSIRLYINQITTSTKTTLFTTPIEILITRENLEDTLIRVNITKNNEVITFSKELKFTSIKSLDPNNFILHDLTDFLSVTDLMKNYIEIYPNPTSNSLNVYTKHPNEYTIRIIDLQGKEVLTSPHVSTSILSLDNIKSGLYVIEIKTNDSLFSQKLVIE